jgi:hypothetical protein
VLNYADRRQVLAGDGSQSRPWQSSDPYIAQQKATDLQLLDLRSEKRVSTGQTLSSQNVDANIQQYRDAAEAEVQQPAKTKDDSETLFSWSCRLFPTKPSATPLEQLVFFSPNYAVWGFIFLNSLLTLFINKEGYLVNTDRRRKDRRDKSLAVEDNRRQTHRRKRDRRKFVRAPIDLWVEEEKGDELYFRRTGNVSVGGLFFEQTIPHTLGTKLTVRFTLPGDSRVIEAIGEVVNTPKSKDALGMGVNFVEISEDNLEIVASFVENTDSDINS